MTISYTSEVATCQGFSCFLKLLARWRGSIYKLVWRDLVVFLLIYYLFNFTYRFLLDQQGKELFESVVKYCKESSTSIPLSFVLGFYVTIIMTRWWNQYLSIPRPDPIAFIVSATISGQDEHGRIIRRTIMRYICLAITMIFTNIASKVKKRFPTIDHFITAGLLEDNEADILKALNKKFPAHSKYWLPLIWASSIIVRARKEGRITSDYMVKTMLDEINKCRANCGQLLNYDRISVPLVYTQVVTLAVYTYFLTVIMGHQWIAGHDYKFDLYFPIFTLLQFFFFMGWLKVAESLINPFGDDDDDFELNWMIDRNLQVCYLIVDEMHDDYPEMMKDQYWDQVIPEELQYTAETLRYKEQHPFTSTVNIAASVNNSNINNNNRNIDEFHVKIDNHGSQYSLASTINDFKRNNSFKRLLSRRNSRNETTDDFNKIVKNQLIDQIIEEVEEQLTIMSKKASPKPSVFDIFKPIETDNEDFRPLSGVDFDENNTTDDFTQLKDQRSEEFRLRIKENIASYLQQLEVERISST